MVQVGNRRRMQCANLHANPQLWSGSPRPASARSPGQVRLLAKPSAQACCVQLARAGRAGVRGLGIAGSWQQGLSPTRAGGGHAKKRHGSMLPCSPDMPFPGSSSVILREGSRGREEEHTAGRRPQTVLSGAGWQRAFALSRWASSGPSAPRASPSPAAAPSDVGVGVRTTKRTPRLARFCFSSLPPSSHLTTTPTQRLPRLKSCA